MRKVLVTTAFFSALAVVVSVRADVLVELSFPAKMAAADVVIVAITVPYYGASLLNA
jgi:hypothetical protein